MQVAFTPRVVFIDKPTGCTVKLHGRVVGQIKRNKFGFWVYTPKGSRLEGPPFANLADAKLSLLDD